MPGFPVPTRFANLLLEQFGGENGELAAVMLYFIQAFGAKCRTRTSTT
ncbi:MAG: manganese catalase family protein [Mucilaginibacter sp.]|nr:manganese catalase family protein [Mucilaginibacter sp.]